MEKPKIHIGTSGWYYEHWSENFYPEKLKPIERLHYYAQNFDTVEINSTFYHLPTEKAIKNWNAQVSDTFYFSIKASQYITHRKRLLDPSETLKGFFERIQFLNDKLAIILFQLPPSFKKDKERLEEFITYLQKNHRYTFEFRHPSWFTDDIYDLLKKIKFLFVLPIWVEIYLRSR